MTATTLSRPPSRAASTSADAAAAPRLGRRARKIALITHIVAAGAWIGIDVVLGVLVFTALLTSDTGTEALCYRALELFAVWPLIVTGLATLVSGIVLGLGTRYGLVRYKWVFVKLVMNIVLVVLVVFLLRPGIADAAAYGEALETGRRLDLDISGLPFPPIVSGTALVIATVLSVVKPWGRLRR
jgi:hypothetical protein